MTTEDIRIDEGTQISKWNESNRLSYFSLEAWKISYLARFDKDAMEKESLEFKEMMTLAADRLEERLNFKLDKKWSDMHCHLFLKFRKTTLWFGLREELEKSIKMLHYQDGYSELIVDS